MKNKIFYELSVPAQEDLENIFDYTAKRYGLEQAISYVSGFNDVFKALEHDPKYGIIRDEVVNGLRSVLKNEHIVFYRILSNRIRIVRVLHARCDLPKFF